MCPILGTTLGYGWYDHVNVRICNWLMDVQTVRWSAAFKDIRQSRMLAKVCSVSTANIVEVSCSRKFAILW